MVAGSNLDLVGLIMISVIISHSSFKKSGKLKRKRVLLGVSLRFFPKFPCFTSFVYKSNHMAVLILPSSPSLAISSSQLLQWWPSHCLSCDCPLSNTIGIDLSLPVASQTHGGCWSIAGSWILPMTAPWIKQFKMYTHLFRLDVIWFSGTLPAGVVLPFLYFSIFFYIYLIVFFPLYQEIQKSARFFCVWFVCVFLIQKDRFLG